jgi:hypothetical protein
MVAIFSRRTAIGRRHQIESGAPPPGSERLKQAIPVLQWKIFSGIEFFL